MSDRHDIENTLRDYRSDAGKRVRRSVMSQFERAANRRAGMWWRPVPMFAVLAIALVATAVSFVAGQRTARVVPAARELPSVASDVPDGVEWVAADSDFL